MKPKNQKGQALLEYILLLAIVVVSSLALSKGMKETFGKSKGKFGLKLEKQIKSGRMATELWQR